MSEASAGPSAGPISRAVGRQIRKVRDDQCWTRADVVRQMSGTITASSLRAYEVGYRPVSLDWLVPICQTLGVSAVDIVALALQNVGIELPTPTLHVDLRAVIASTQPELLPFARWARVRLAGHPYGSNVIRLDRMIIDHLAVIPSIPYEKLVEQLRTFTPELAPWRAP